MASILYCECKQGLSLLKPIFAARMGMGAFPPAASKRNSLDRSQLIGNNVSSSRSRNDRQTEARAVNDSCPLEIGHDPRRESIGGGSAPAHLKGFPPLRVLPEVICILASIVNKLF